MKLETHAHCRGASICADITEEQLISTYKQLNYDAVILTNHINWGWETYPANDYKGRVEYFLNVFKKVKKLGQKENIKVFLGAEVVTLTETNIHQEFLIVGFNEDFLFNCNLVNTCNQKKLFDIANKNELFMWQSHPFRTGEETGNPEYMHGAEAFNGHFHHDNFNEKAKDFCLNNKIKMISGSDCHHVGQPILGGINLPNGISSEKQLARYLLNNQPKLLFSQEEYIGKRREYVLKKEQSK